MHIHIHSNSCVYASIYNISVKSIFSYYFFFLTFYGLTNISN